jgi:hypothetical protein
LIDSGIKEDEEILEDAEEVSKVLKPGQAVIVAIWSRLWISTESTETNSNGISEGSFRGDNGDSKQYIPCPPLGSPSTFRQEVE